MSSQTSSQTPDLTVPSPATADRAAPGGRSRIRRLPRRVRRAVARRRRRALARVRALGRLTPRELLRSRRENAAFLDAITGGTLGHLDVSEGEELRSMTLLRDLTAATYRAGPLALPVRTGALRWTSPRTNLREAAVAAAWEALETGRMSTAQWLADQVIRQQPRYRPAQDLQATLSARQCDPEGALVWQRRRLRVPRRKASPKAEMLVTRQTQLLDARRLMAMLTDRPAADPGRTTGIVADVETLWADTARREAATAEDVIPAVLAALDNGRTPLLSRRYFEAFVGGRLSRGEDLSRYRPLLEHLSRMNGPKEVPLATPEVARSIRSMSLEAFRHYVAGKSICLIANSPTLIGSGLGRTIDSYDLVMRFNSFVIEPEDTGSRTSVHVTIHMHDYNWDVPVPVRIVISGKPHLWRRSLKVRLRPGAQEWVGDASLRWPGRTLGLIGPDDPFKLPTAGFQFMRLLMHLDVSTAIDLIGFDFYESGKLRVTDAMSIPHSPGHNSAAERDWVLAHAVRVSPMIISMREEGLA